MNKFILLTFGLLSIATITTSIQLHCAYYTRTSNFYAIKGVYTCQIQGVNSQDSHDALVTGTHRIDKSNSDVIGIWDSNGRLETFPRGLGEVFENLIAFYISGGNIKEIHQEDLKPYPNMVALVFDGSKIEVIERGLFDYNPYLEAVVFDSKMIRHISSNAFDNLSNLKYLILSGCASARVIDNRDEVKNEIERVKPLCEEYVETAQASTISRRIYSEKLTEASCSASDCFEMNEKIEYLSKKVINLDEKYNSLAQTVNNLLITIGNLESALRHPK
ncbi:uncharacterized protein [Chironomus tepperi]|uniref:uncharacterized protein n=1 Tax=Chironomus tepperi TaxID=113505 RepID=UPI00391F8ADC